MTTIYELCEHLTLTDPGVVARVLRETIPGPGDETELGFLLCDRDGRLVDALLLRGLDVPSDPDQADTLLRAMVAAVGRAGSVAAFVVRHGPLHPLGDERRWQEDVQRGCARHGVDDLGFYVVGRGGVDHAPRLELVA